MYWLKLLVEYLKENSFVKEMIIDIDEYEITIKKTEKHEDISSCLN